MRFNSSIKMLTLSIVASTIFVGCGGSDGDATTAVSTQTGTFVDAPVEGLKYITATQSGFTDTNGKYKFVNGENIEFFLGNLSLGKSAAQTLMTPYTLGSSDITTPSTITKNIAMLLQNMDQNRSNTDKLIIAVGLRDYNFLDLNLSSATLESDVTDLLATPDIQSNIDVNNSLVTLAVASSALEEYVVENSMQYDLKFTQDYLNGKTLSRVILEENRYVTENIFFDFSDNNKVDFEDNVVNSETYGQTITGYSGGEGILVIRDGKVLEYVYDYGFPYDGINIYTITSVDNDRIVTSMLTVKRNPKIHHYAVQKCTTL